MIADNGDQFLKVFDSNGNFILNYKPQTDDVNTRLHIIDVATDVDNNTFVLVGLWKTEAEGNEPEVQVFNNNFDLLRKFRVRRGVKGGYWGRMTVACNKVLVSRHTGSKYVVDVYKHDGAYVRSLGEGILKDEQNISADNDGRVALVDTITSCVHVLAVDGQQH